MSKRQSAIVTGGASGIGKASVELLAERGWAVTVADRDAEAGESVAAQIRDRGGAAQFIAVDVANEANVRDMVSFALSAYGALDGAINSAGVEGAGKPVHETEAAEWDRCNNINLRGAFLCLKYQVAAMWPNERGSVVAISSAAATKGLMHSADYCASKAGICGLVRSAAIDCAERNIRINAVLPGATLTPLAIRSAAANPGLDSTLFRPMSRLADPREIAAAAVWLLSEEASFVTGANIAADGGMTAA